MTLFLPIVTMFHNVALFLIVIFFCLRWKLAFEMWVLTIENYHQPSS